MSWKVCVMVHSVICSRPVDWFVLGEWRDIQLEKSQCVLLRTDVSGVTAGPLPLSDAPRLPAITQPIQSQGSMYVRGITGITSKWQPTVRKAWLCFNFQRSPEHIMRRALNEPLRKVLLMHYGNAFFFWSSQFVLKTFLQWRTVVVLADSEGKKWSTQRPWLRQHFPHIQWPPKRFWTLNEYFCFI